MSGNTSTPEAPTTGRIDPDEEPFLYSVDNAAIKLGISVRNVWNLVGTGQLASKMLGGRRVITPEALKEFVASLPDGKTRGAVA